jgi:hypothetical protein
MSELVSDGEERERLIAFLSEIGIDVIVGSDTNGGFLDTCKIEKGHLIASPNTPISDILHEAGHLAILPEIYRTKVTGDSDEVIREIHKSIFLAHGEDHPFPRAIVNSSDQAATAWAWAAGRHLGIAPEKIIQDSDYDNSGHDMRIMLSTGMYAGIHSLAHAGFCQTKRNPYVNEGAVWPELNYWVTPAAPDQGIMMAFGGGGPAESGPLDPAEPQPF